MVFDSLLLQHVRLLWEESLCSPSIRQPRVVSRASPQYCGTLNGSRLPLQIPEVLSLLFIYLALLYHFLKKKKKIGVTNGSETARVSLFLFYLEKSFDVHVNSKIGADFFRIRIFEIMILLFRVHSISVSFLVRWLSSFNPLQVNRVIWTIYHSIHDIWAV